MNNSDPISQAAQNIPTHSTGGPAPVHVWLVDDHAGLRALIAESLERQGGIICTRQFHSPNALLSALASRIGPDVILLDVQMGEANGIDAIPAIKSLSRATRVLMLTTCYDEQWHSRALERGASGFLLKSDPLERIAGSICIRDETDKRFMRAEPVKIRVRPSAAAPVKATTKPGGLNRKTAGILGWFKLFGRN